MPSDGVFVRADMADTLVAQQERVWALVRRGRRSMLLAAALLVGALFIAVPRGFATWSSVLLVVIVLVLAGVLTLVDRRLVRHPPGTVEVPVDLADLIVEIYQVRDELEIYGPDLLPPAQYEKVMRVVNEHVAEIVSDATNVLAVERAGDRTAAAELRADIEQRFAAVTDIYDDVDIHADKSKVSEPIDGQDQVGHER
jgi:hypothetical protein